MFKLRYLLPLALAAGLLAAPAVASADQATASISFNGTGTITSTGVDVPLHYLCQPSITPPSSTGSILARIFQNGVSSTPGTATANCDGQEHSITVSIPGIFTPGTVEGQAALFNPDFTSGAATSANINIG